MNDQTHESSDLSRRRFLKSTAVGLAAASTLGLGANTGKANESSAPGPSAIPELAPQWKKLDLAEILSRPAAFVSISQNKPLYETWGGSPEATGSSQLRADDRKSPAQKRVDVGPYLFSSCPIR